MAGIFDVRTSPNCVLNDLGYIRASLGEFRGLELRGEVLQPRITADHPLTAEECSALNSVGYTADTDVSSDAGRARRESLHVFFHVLQTALPTVTVAAWLRVSSAHIRQRIRQLTLLAIRDGRELQRPLAQFHNQREIPGLRYVLPALPLGMSTIEVLSWLVTPSNHFLDTDEAMQSPHDYLLTTNDAKAVQAPLRRHGESSCR